LGYFGGHNLLFHCFIVPGDETTLDVGFVLISSFNGGNNIAVSLKQKLKAFN